MNQIIRQPYVLNSFSAAAATDISTSGGFIKFAGAALGLPDIYYPTANSTITAAVAEVLAVGTVIFASTASTLYKFLITQLNTNTGLNEEYTVEYTSGATTSAAIIAAAINTQIRALALGALRVTSAGGSTTITITALTGNAIFKLTGVSNVTCLLDGTGGTTVGVYPKGTAAQVNAVPGINTGAVSGHIYNTIVFNGFSNTSSLLTGRGTSGFQQTIYLDQNATNYAAFLAGLTNVLNGLKVAGAVADPELISAQ